MSALADAAAEHLKALVQCRSVTPEDGGAQAYLADVLARRGYTVERLKFTEPGTPDVDNLFATIGGGSPHFVFAGHTDVVPPGDETKWHYPPFAAKVSEGILFGRGAVDMKGGIAAFLAAALARGTPARGTLSFLITGDEEGPSVNGTRKLIAWAREQGHRFDAALVGEPTSRQRLGDTVKIGRRGSLSGTVTVTGKQGHAAYPHLADNPVPALVRILSRLTRLKLDEGSADFEPSNLEVVSLETSTDAFNVIPGEAHARFNVRFNDFWSVSALKALVKREIAEAADCELSFEPMTSDWFMTSSPALLKPLSQAIEAVAGVRPETSTGGGTSDARFFKDVCPVVEFGLVNETIHQVNERVALSEVGMLADIYRNFLDRYFGTTG